MNCMLGLYSCPGVGKWLSASMSCVSMVSDWEIDGLRQLCSVHFDHVDS